jgi:hypothetical protein
MLGQKAISYILYLFLNIAPISRLQTRDALQTLNASISAKVSPN